MNKPDFYNRRETLAVLALGGLIGFAKDIVVGILYLYRLALTPDGVAALLVATLLISVTALMTALLRR